MVFLSNLSSSTCSKLSKKVRKKFFKILQNWENNTWPLVVRPPIFLQYSYFSSITKTETLLSHEYLLSYRKKQKEPWKEFSKSVTCEVLVGARWCCLLFHLFPSWYVFLYSLSLPFHSFSFKNTNFFYFIFEQERDEKWEINITNNNKMGTTRLLFF